MGEVRKFDPPGEVFSSKNLAPENIPETQMERVCLRTYNHHFSGAFAVKLLEGMNVVILMKPQKTWRIGKPFVEPKKYGRC